MAGNVPPSWQSKVGPIARRQRSLVTTPQLEDAGLGESGRAYAVASGRLLPLRRGVLQLPGVKPSWETTVLAAVLAAGRGVVASHLTAARLWGLLDRPPPGKCAPAIHLTAPSDHRLDGVIVHRRRLSAAERGSRHDVPVTSVARTLFDLATELGPQELGEATDEAIRRRLMKLADLADLYDRHRGPGRRRLEPVRLVLADRLPGYDPGANAWELRMDRLWDRLGLPPADRQFRVQAGGRRYRLDRAIVPIRLAVEWVGAEYHTLDGRYRRDRRRTSDLIQAGWDLLEVTPDWTPDRLYATVMAKVQERQRLFASS